MNALNEIVAADSPSVEARIAGYDWSALAAALGSHGCATMEGLLTSEECREIAGFYKQEERFRSRVDMARHGFGKGQYQYFRYPLPELIGALRTSAYPHLARVANDWNATLRTDRLFPQTHREFLDICRAAEQDKPTPLLLQYGPGDYNCLHQDLYGELVFPLQMAILLSDPGEDFAGGEFVLTEQRPRMQSRAEVVPLRRGDAVVFAVHHRPAQGTRGTYRVNLRHGVSRIRSGQRHTLGIIFHDAR
jgi:uncharacterized protein